MASHSGRPGAIRKKGTKKGAQVGTGGHSRRRLEGKGPTPKAEDRTYHPAHKRKVKREAREAQEAAIARARAKSSIRVKSGHELIAGRNPVAEAARTSVPIERVFVLDNVKDDRVEEVVRLASAMGAPVYEVTRRDLDVATDGAVHQGVAIEVRGYEYADASDLIAGSLQQLGHPADRQLGHRAALIEPAGKLQLHLKALSAQGLRHPGEHLTRPGHRQGLVAAIGHRVLTQHADQRPHPGHRIQAGGLHPLQGLPKDPGVGGVARGALPRPGLGQALADRRTQLTGQPQALAGADLSDIRSQHGELGLTTVEDAQKNS